MNELRAAETASEAFASALKARVVLIDGRSGSGKTTLAEQFAARLGAQTLHLDDLYPGWGGLAEGSAAVAQALSQGWYLPYDWAAGGFSQAKVMLDADLPLVIEGCGAVTATNLREAARWAGSESAVCSVWLDCEDESRKARALARDGEMLAPHWDEWAAQEARHFGEHLPWRLATRRIAAADVLREAPSSQG